MAIQFGFPRRMPWVTANGRSYKDVRFTFVEGAVDVGDMGVFNPKTGQVTWMKGGTATCCGYPDGEQGKVNLLMQYLEAEDDRTRDRLRADIYDALTYITDQTPGRVIDVQRSKGAPTFVVIEEMGWIEYELTEAGVMSA
ncbi:hypothetical protein A6J80_22650 (plasmid) [Paracoccus yeei]|uniref:Uncharacterized protein n=1 Tax=Paracoccus yeei TaxID=147645 RepID=A0A1V0GZ80_9RHOB|nr:hypothetical protein [Paracoccus yeei]ARC39090.1 hypothetical protein A6J80_22650 [Paracoccus yeei]